MVSGVSCGIEGNTVDITDLITHEVGQLFLLLADSPSSFPSSTWRASSY